MKRMTHSIVFLLVVLATPVIYGNPPAPGVAGVDVIVKEVPGNHTITDAGGNFAFAILAPGSYTLVFRAQKADMLHATTKSEVLVALTYSIKIEGTKHSVNQRGLTSDKLIAGADIPVELGPGGKIRGQVLAGAFKKMVWINPQIGTHMPGHWVEADSNAAATAHNVVRVNPDDLRNHLVK